MKLKIDFPAVGRIREQTQIDLMGVLTDPMTIADVWEQLRDVDVCLAVMVAIEDKVDDDGFLAAYFEDSDDIPAAIMKASNAVILAVTNFIPPSIRSTALTLLEKSGTAAKNVILAAQNEAAKAMEDPDFIKALEKSVRLSNGSNECSASSESQTAGTESGSAN